MIKPDDFLHKILSTEGEQATVDKAFRFVFLVLILGLSCSMPAYATGPSMDVFDTEDAPSDRQPAEPATDEESPGTSHDAAQPGDEAPSDAAVQKPRFPIWGVIDNPVKDKANIREGAWSERDKVGRVQNGVKVEILGESKGWYKVKVGSTTGWIRKKKINTGENANTRGKTRDTSSWGNEDWWDDKKLLDPVYNARILYKMTRGGTYWKPWGLTADGKAMDASCLPDVEQREAAGMDLEQLQEILRHVSTIVCCKN